RALRRRVKRHVLAQTHDFVAVCSPGLEWAVTRELAELPVAPTIIERIKGGVHFRGRTDLMYTANLHLRTASRVLMRVATFPAPTTEALFNRSKKVRWETFIGDNRGIRLSVTSRKSRVNHKRKIESIIEDAVNSRLRELGLPTVTSSTKAELRFHVRLDGDQCTLSFNTSGEHLHKRGWRRLATVAPIRETLASYVLLAARFETARLIVDPFCGSGTLCIEAAQAIAGIPSGLNRRFSFELSPLFEPRKWEYYRRQAKENIRSSIPGRIVGFDIDEKAINIARLNAARGGVADFVDFYLADALKVPLSKLAEGTERQLLVSNLPYGKRLSSPEFLGTFAKVIQNNCVGWHLAVLCVDPSPFESLPLESRSVQGLNNGGIRVKLLQGTVANDSQ
ncbi:MAG TPA: THUMP domain-containing protein, partial [Trueperaceae bacterium]